MALAVGETHLVSDRAARRPDWARLSADWGRWPAIGWVFACGWAMLVGSFWNYLNFTGYPLFGADVLLGTLVLAVVAWIPAPFAALGRPGMALVTGIIAYAAMAMNAPDYWPWAVGWIAAALAWWKGPHIARIIMIVFVVVAIFAWIRPSPPLFEQSGEQRSPGEGAPLVYVILDEAGGSTQLDEFRVWPQARTLYTETTKSIPHIYDDHFAALREAGYATEVWQTDWAPFCKDYCLTYHPFRLAGAHRIEPLGERTRLLLTAFTALLPMDSWLYVVAGSRWYRWWMLPMQAQDVAERFVPRVAGIRQGEALVLHIILPHQPYVLDEQCEPLPRSQWNTPLQDQPVAATRASHARQFRCAERLVRKMVEAAPQATFVVHSDHGDRTGGLRDASPERHKNARQAFFALRTPTEKGRREEASPYVSDLMARFAENGFVTVEEKPWS